MKEIIFLNGKFLSASQAKVSPLEPGFLYGWGLFETMRWRNNKIIYFDAHLKRLERSAGLLDIKCVYTKEALKSIVRRVAGINRLEDACIRINLGKCAKGTDVLVTAKKYKPYSAGKYNQGFSACISSLRQGSSSYFSQLKTTNYLLYRLAHKEALDKGLDEAVILNHKGYIAETSKCNLFFIKGKELFTPSLECGCLDGITRRSVFDLCKKQGIKVFKGNFSIPDLYSGDEAFLTNSLVGIMPLASVEKHRITVRGKQNKLTRFLMEKYRFLSTK
jgi:branched-subunit amino acid aminotransferase/4-amino-4-deoxychorismate lyase